MKKLYGFILALATAAIVIPHAHGLGTPSPPPGISASDWIPLGEDAGLVIAHAHSPIDMSKSTAGTVKGYFVVRRAHRWLRVDTASGYDLEKTGLIH